jgi:His Kinase A (phospho-acceptor) domain
MHTIVVFLTRAVPLRDARGKILKWYGTSTDIEEREHAKQLQADLAHINRMTTLGELTASLPHELKQPIAASVMNANACVRWLKREKPDLEEACAATSRIVEDQNRAADLIERLQSLYKKSAPKRELVEVNEIVHEMLVLVRGETYRYAISTRTDLAADLPRIAADHVQLQQALMNLMLNGIEAMKLSGRTNPDEIGSPPPRWGCNVDEIGSPPPRWGCNVELREDIRYTSVDLACLAIDLDSYPEIQDECAGSFPVIHHKKMFRACTLPRIGNSSSHACEENV